VRWSRLAPAMAHTPVEKAAPHVAARRHAMAVALAGLVSRPVGAVVGLPERLLARYAAPGGGAVTVQDVSERQAGSLGTDWPPAARLVDRETFPRAPNLRRARQRVHRQPAPRAKLRPEPRVPPPWARQSVEHDHRSPPVSPDRLRPSKIAESSVAARARARCVAEGGIRVDPVQADLAPAAWRRLSGRRPRVDGRPPKFPRPRCPRRR
jgi:hypothetical protein